MSGIEHSLLMKSLLIKKRLEILFNVLWIRIIYQLMVHMSMKKILQM
jgi:hypothetical protein